MILLNELLQYTYISCQHVYGSNLCASYHHNNKLHISCYSKKNKSSHKLPQKRSINHKCAFGANHIRWALKRKVKKGRWREDGLRGGRDVWRRWTETIYINCYYTYTSNLYMYIIATHLITFKFKFLYKLLLV